MTMPRRRVLGAIGAIAATAWARAAMAQASSAAGNLSTAITGPAGDMSATDIPGRDFGWMRAGGDDAPAAPFVASPEQTAGPAAQLPPDPALIQAALAAATQHSALLVSRDVIGLVDFALPSRAPRFYLLDGTTGTVVSAHLVAHGRGSDPANRGVVERLSNRPGSNASCSGSFLVGSIYQGHHGASRRLEGLDPENSEAAPRGIVIHGAAYVDPVLAAIEGRIGRSQGCFAVAETDLAHVLETLGQGRLLFAGRSAAA